MSSNELHDLGLTRYNTATAAITDKDYALTAPSSSTSLAPRVLATAAGPAPKGYESAVHAWNTFQYTTEEVNAREELKGDLHGGQLHRENRAVRELEARMGGGGWGQHDGRGGFGGGRGGFGGFGGDRGGAGAGKRGGIGNTAGGEQGAQLALCAGRKPEGGGPPLAKGMAAEMDKSMFWDGEIV